MRTIVKMVIAGLMFASASHAADFNVRVSPKLFLGFLNAKVDYKVKDNISVGGIYEYTFNYLDYHTVGGGVNIKLDGKDIMKHDGWLVNPCITYSFGRFDTDKSVSRISSTTYAAVLAKQWIWKNGFNTRFGFGFQYNTVKYLGYSAFPFLSLTLGFVF